MTRFALTAAAAATLFAASPALADFNEIMVVAGTPWDMSTHVVAQIYATGDVEPGDVLSLVIDADICAVGVEFFDHPMGDDVAPTPEMLALYPQLRYDTFATINRLEHHNDTTEVIPGFAITAESVHGSWGAFHGNSGPGVPGAPSQRDAVTDWHPTEPDRAGVLIAQLTFEIPADLGAYEGIAGTMRLFTEGGSPSGTVVRFQVGIDAHRCAADLNADGEVGPADLSMLMQQWTEEPQEETAAPFADINGDGAVNAADLSALLDAWGRCYYECH